MKKILFPVIIFFCLHSFGQDSYNIDFKKIINDYRKDFNLDPIQIDTSLKKFADDHVNYMSHLQKVTHGENEFKFSNRWKNFRPNHSYAGENCTELFVPKKTITGKIETSITELNPVLEKIIREGPSIKDLITYAFLLWKNSPSHNEFLLDKKIHFFYFSVKKNGFWYYCEFVAYANPNSN